MTTRTQTQTTPITALLATLTQRPWLWMLPIILLSFWLGAYGLDVDAYWLDEYYTLRDVGAPPNFEPNTPAEIWTTLAENNPVHPPGYYVLLGAWGQLVDWSLPLLRAYALLTGIVALAWTYRIGRDLVSPQVGLFSALILGTSAFYTYYLHETRMYGQALVLITFTLWLYFRILDAKRVTPLMWIGFFFGAVSIMYTLYLASLILALIGVYHLLFAPRFNANPANKWLPGARWWGVVGVGLAAGLVFLPWVNVLRAGLNRTGNLEWLQQTGIEANEVFPVIVTLFGHDFTLLLGAVLLLSFAGLVAWGRREGVWRIWLFALGLPTALLAINAVHTILEPNRMRYFVLSWPLLAMLVGLGVAFLFGRASSSWAARTRQVTALVLLVAWCGVGVVRSLDTNFSKLGAFTIRKYDFPLHTLTTELRDQVQPNDLIVTYLSDRVDPWTYDMITDNITPYYFQGITADYVTVRSLQRPENRQRALVNLVEDAQSRGRVWTAFMPDAPLYIRDQHTEVFNQVLNLCDTPIQDSDLLVNLYAPSSVCCPNSAETDITYRNGIIVSGIDAQANNDSRDVNLNIGWRLPPDTTREAPYVVVFELVDTAQTVQFAQDYTMLPNASACQPVTFNLGDVPAGEYIMRLTLRDPITGEAIMGTREITQQTGTTLGIGVIDVPAT